VRISNINFLGWGLSRFTFRMEIEEEYKKNKKK
jgi:hypothetical protein